MRDSTCFALCALGCYGLELSATYALAYMVPYSVRPVLLVAVVLAAVATLGFAFQAERAWINGD